MPLFVIPQFMSEPGISQQAPRSKIVVIVDENTSGNDAERSFEDTHIAVEQEVLDVGAVEQRANRRYENGIIGSQ